MANPQPLEKLRDIHLPEAISGWHWTLGWSLLLMAAFVGLLFTARVGYRRYRHGYAKRQALQLLTQYEQAYRIDRDSQRLCAEVSTLLRRVALVYFPREQVASLTDEQWIDFLNKTSKKSDFESVREQLLTLPYQHKVPHVNLDALLLGAKSWIKQRGMLCTN